MENIILIGYMGSGKSTVARELHQRNNMEIIDTDSKIVKEQGKSINEIFAQDGETAFRDLETDCLKQLSEKKDSFILSTGGGMPVREENRALLKNLGTVFFLKADTDTILERVKHDTARPLLQDEDRRSKIETMLMTRTPLYEAAADYIIVTDGRTVEEIAGEIISVINR